MTTLQCQDQQANPELGLLTELSCVCVVFVQFVWFPPNSQNVLLDELANINCSIVGNVCVHDAPRSSAIPWLTQACISISFENFKTVHSIKSFEILI